MGKPTPPTDEDRIDNLAMQDQWRRERYGITMEGSRERAAELVKMPPRPPAFEPAP